MSLSTLPKVQKLQDALHAKAKGSPNWANWRNADGAVDYHAVRRLRQWLCQKHKVRGAGLSRFSAESLYLELRLVRLRWIKRNFPWANA